MRRISDTPTVPFRQEIGDGYYGFSVPDRPAESGRDEISATVARFVGLFRELASHESPADESPKAGSSV